MLLQIRTRFEKCLEVALPEFKRFNARVTRINIDELPCVDLYFHRDCLVENQNYYEQREALFEIELCFSAKSDAESELAEVRRRIEWEVENDKDLENMVVDWLLKEVDFAHEMVGNRRVAALAMTYSIVYQKPRRLPPDFKARTLQVNGEILE